MPDPRGLQRRLATVEQALQRRQPTTTRVELWDQGGTISSAWHHAFEDGHLPTANNGTVEPCEVYEHPYIYLGWAVSSSQMSTVEAIENFESNLLEEPDGLIHRIEETPAAAHEDWELTIPLTAADPATTIYRLREGIERFLITDINNSAASSQAQSATKEPGDRAVGNGFNPGVEPLEGFGRRAQALEVEGPFVALERLQKLLQRVPVGAAGGGFEVHQRGAVDALQLGS